MMDLKESDFLDRLQTSLSNQGIPSERDFHLPGGTHRIGLYLPQLPRASVEIKSIQNLEQLAYAVAEIAKKHEMLSKELGVTFKTFLIILHAGDRNPAWEQKTPGGVICLYIEGDLEKKRAIEEAAVKIQEEIKAWRIRIIQSGIAIGSIVGPVGAVAGAAIGGLGWLGILGSAGVLGGLFSRLPPRIPQEEKSALSSSYPSDDALRIVASQVSNILETFKDLAPETHTVLAHEMQFLLEEFRLGHFTACAMRGGRSLETMVYELSRRWGIDIQDATFGKLDELHKILDRISDLIGDYQVSSNAQRKTLDEDISKALISLNTNAMSLALAVKGEQQIQLSNAEIAPRPVVSLLKKIQKRYGHLDGTGENIRSLFVKDPDSQDGSLIARIIRIRNRAAHADTQGKMQEIDEASVRKLIDDINVMLLRLSNVGIAIQNHCSDGVVEDGTTPSHPTRIDTKNTN